MRKTLTIGVALAFGFAGVELTASPALAVGSCGSSGICFYDTGVSADWMEYLSSADIQPGGCKAMYSNADNKTSYIVNTSGAQWKTYSNRDCTGVAGTIYAHSSGTMDSAHNNNISSYKKL